MKEAEQIVSQLNWLINELRSYEESELAEKKARVKAVSKSIETLQRGNLPVPEDLVRMRDALWTELEELDHPEKVLSYLRDELHVVLKRIPKPGRSGGTEQQRAYSGRISNETPRFTQSDLESILIDVLHPGFPVTHNESNNLPDYHPSNPNPSSNQSYRLITRYMLTHNDDNSICQ